jgi:hypothetical protein
LIDLHRVIAPGIDGFAQAQHLMGTGGYAQAAGFAALFVDKDLTAHRITSFHGCSKGIEIAD